MAKRIEKIKLNNVEYNIDSDVLADAVQGGSTLAAKLKAEVAAHPGRLLLGISGFTGHNDAYIFSPVYWDETDTDLPYYYTTIQADKGKMITVGIDWDTLTVDDVITTDLGGKPIEIVDLTDL